MNGPRDWTPADVHVSPAPRRCAVRPDLSRAVSGWALLPWLLVGVLAAILAGLWHRDHAVTVSRVHDGSGQCAFIRHDGSGYYASCPAGTP